MKGCLLLTFGCMFVIAVTAESYAQSSTNGEARSWTRFSESGGLPSNNIYDVLDDENGTPWAWTQEGVAWYDGYKWNTIDASVELPHSNVTRIQVFHKGGVVLRSGSEMWSLNKQRILKLPIDSVVSCVAISQDSLLVEQNGSFYCLVANKKDQWERVLAPFDVNTRIQGSSRNGFKVVSRGYSLFLQRWGWQRLLLNHSSSTIYTNRVDVNIHGDGIAWIRSPQEYEGIWLWRALGRLKRKVLRAPQSLITVAIDQTGERAAYADNGFLHIHKDGDWRVECKLPTEAKKIVAMRFRPNGDLWLATTNGLFLYQLHSAVWTNHYWEAEDARNSVNDIFIDNRSSVWLGTSGGVVHITKSGAQTLTSKVRGNKIHVVTGIQQDMEGNIWISSGSGFYGLWRWDGVTWKHVSLLYRNKPVFIHKIFRDRSGRLWFAGHSFDASFNNDDNPGFFVLEKGKIEPWFQNSGLPHKRVYAFAEAGNGAYWFATYDGVARWHNGNWKYFTPGDRAIPEIVRTLDVDRDNRVYYAKGDGGKGVCVIEPTDSTWQMTMDNGLPDVVVRQIRCDSYRRVWITTHSGLGLYADGMFLMFDERSGLRSPALWPVAPLKDSVYVGTMQSGWALLDLKALDMQAPEVDILNPVVDNDHVMISWSAFTPWGNILPESILTRYRLDDGEWSPWSQSRHLKLEKMRPGNYTVTIQAKGMYGQENAGVRVPFTVQSHALLRWYTLGPIVILSLGLLTIVAVYIRRRRSYVQDLEESHERLKVLAEQLVDTEERERRRMAHFLHDSIGQTLSLVYMKLHRWQTNGMPADESIDGARTMLDQVIRDTHTLTFELCPPFIQDLTLDKALKWVVEWVEKLHGSVIETSIQCEQVAINKELHVLLVMAVRELLVNAIKHADAQYIQMSLTREEGGALVQVRDNGCGFPSSSDEASSKSTGFGLQNMKNRFQDFGVVLRIESVQGKGSVVSIHVPEALVLNSAHGNRGETVPIDPFTSNEKS